MTPTRREPAPLPSEVRAKILGQHKELRKLLAVIRALSEQVLAGERGALSELRRQSVELETVFLAHLETEEAILLPILKTIDAWGAVRVQHIEEEHARQRAVLDSAGNNATSAAVPPQQLAQLMRSVVDDILEDMKSEERDMLDPRLLRDDPVVDDQSDG